MAAVGKPMLELMVERLRMVPSLDGIIVATTVNQDDDAIVELARRLGVGCHRGSEENVLSRVLDAAMVYGVDVIVETTGDCPCIDPGVVERCVRAYLEGQADYVSNTLRRTYPIGMDVEIFGTKTLSEAAARTNDPYDQEHVSPAIYRHPDRYRLVSVEAPPAHRRPDIHITLDEPDDYRFIVSIFEALYRGNPSFSLSDMLELFARQPELLTINSHVRRKSGPPA